VFARQRQLTEQLGEMLIDQERIVAAGFMAERDTPARAMVPNITW
jgi:hypothetical protein